MRVVHCETMLASGSAGEERIRTEVFDRRVTGLRTHRTLQTADLTTTSVGDL